MTTSELILRIAVAFALGAMIGAERQWRQRLAGLRTNTLVCVGSALFVSLAIMTPDELSPTRIAAQVVSGIGFLGAGVIFKEGLTVKGLNTAATLWCSAAVGVLAGSGHFDAAAIGAGAVLAANTVLRPLMNAINRQPKEFTEVEVGYRLKLVCSESKENDMRAKMLSALDEAAVTLHGIWSEDTDDERHARVHADLVAIGRQDTQMERVLRKLSTEPGVTSISWEVRPSNNA
ncbi:MAG: MgtC/SapB family protein [Phycisphaerales bacterium]|nr:MAG: MgtC/SapB family protein [Phycisphaerales bacterium]